MKRENSCLMFGIIYIVLPDVNFLEHIFIELNSDIVFIPASLSTSLVLTTYINFIFEIF